MGTITPLRFSGTYEDEQGREEISWLLQPSAHSWRKPETFELHTVIRGVEFHGSDFEGLAALDRDAAAAAGLDPDLCDCRLSGGLPVQVTATGGQRIVLAEFSCELRNGTAEIVRVAIEIDGTVHQGTGEYFEDCLDKVQRTFPPGTFLMSCHTCQWSGPVLHYQNVLGVRCCRDAGRQHLDAPPNGRHWRVPVAEWVPDTHLCARYARRTPTTPTTPT
ncbi:MULTISPECIES: DUF6304 family protein [Kitasatospora]|uniref:Uncharacterized protein n=1 Tax=Kitasatospora setae (strain ATCC 33774 / DSM 43861 / JCM 3304 / KCC A-0304 / NBRC 14216 / KM-6054) TaxID=452652 RepID=E4NJ33_KITSK|nr:MULTISPECIES: DUF6304 family protein [Kitasatospora]BAJ32981.1 hypothetical protein KSE_72260 [Kitasatospora setae KM-6054]